METVLVLPDGCVDIVWQPGRGAFVAGPDTGPVPTPAAPGGVSIGVRFRPGAGGAALGVPLAELRDLRVDFADLHPDLARKLPPGLEPALVPSRMLALTEELVAKGPPDPLVAEAARLLADPRTRTAGLVRTLKVSERQLRRRFDAGVGYGPKTLQRVLRLQRFLAHIGGGPLAASLADLAVRSGYADQAHLTRESGRLAGLTPASLVERATTSR